MHRYWLFAVLGLCAFAVPAGCRAASPEASIRAGYVQIARATERKDFVALGRYLAPAWYVIDPVLGKVGRARALAEFPKQYQALKNIKDAYRVTRISRRGALMAVEYTETMRAQVSDGRKMHPIVVTNRGLDAWKQYGAAWKMASSAMLETTVRVDGRVIQHAKAKPNAGAAIFPK